MSGGTEGGDRLEVIEVVFTSAMRRVSKAFDRELRRVVSGHGPASADRLELRRRMRDANAWVRRAVLADAA